MTFILSERSLNNLVGVDERLVEVVKRAIEITKVDFGVIEGVRTPEKQLEYFNKGASQIAVGGTHVHGKAVDLMAYIGARGSWELNLYDDIADAMKAAAIEQDVAIRWGGAWTVSDIRKWQGTMESAMNAYIDDCRSKGRRPFIDGPHFELV
jgi:peptidoglycan L-alanyl-D-glutamate endopeptidase CwlK